MQMRSGPTSDSVILVLTEPGREPRLVVVSGSTEVGRSAAGVALDDPEASRLHARFLVEDGVVRVEDLGSRNGTFVNGSRIESATVLHHGDWVDVGACRFDWDDRATTRRRSTSRSRWRSRPARPATGPSVPSPRDVAVQPAEPRRWTAPVAMLSGLAVIVLLRLFVFQAFEIPSESMEPILQKRDRVLVWTWGAGKASPGYDDVIVFDNPRRGEPGEERFLIKRVIGRPGDQLAFDGGVVVRNGERLVEPWVAAGVPTENLDSPYQCTVDTPCVVPDGHVWVMGDNRTMSSDSRAFGPIANGAVVGHATTRIWPLSRLGGL